MGGQEITIDYRLGIAYYDSRLIEGATKWKECLETGKHGTPSI